MIQMSFFFAHSAIAFSSASVYTAPVGLQGEHRIIPRVSLWLARSRSLTLTLSPHSGSPGTRTGSARVRCTICGYDTHAGEGISTRSFGPKRVKHALKIDCLEPELTMMLSGLTARLPDMTESWWAMPVRSSAIPTFGG